MTTLVTFRNVWVSLAVALAAISLTGCRESTERKEPAMAERTGLVTMRGNPVTLLGDAIEVGQAAPDVELVANDLSTVKLSSFKGQVCILTSVPSLDTPVAQARWCGATGVDNVQTLSDHREAAFGTSYGVLIKGLRLLARAVFVLDRDGVVHYQQLVDEVTEEPDYEAALDAAKKLL
jgi:thiol peroxidase